jgi:hypothetical protein
MNKRRAKARRLFGQTVYRLADYQVQVIRPFADELQVFVVSEC